MTDITSGLTSTAILTSFADLELAGNDANPIVPGLRSHLAGCPACREEHASLNALVGAEKAL